MSTRNDENKPHYRAIWISDVHLGFKDCKANFLLNFLNSVESDTLYLVGDIVDLWSMKRQFFGINLTMKYLPVLSKKQKMALT